MPAPFITKLRAGMMLWALAVAGCTPLPTAELNAYVATFETFEDVSNDVLDLIVPYERAGTRKTRYTAASCPDDQPSVLANDPYCYGIRDAFATIGDPALVRSYRSLVATVVQFNAIIVAYAEGVSFRFVREDIDAFSGAIGVLGNTATREFAGLTTALQPVAAQSLAVRDRRALEAFITENVDLVDTVFAQMALQSGALYANVDSGTQYLIAVGAGNTAALRSRREEMRNIIANWTVLIDQTRSLLQKAEAAIANPDALTVRLRNLGDETFEVDADFRTLRDQISAIGTGGAFE